MAESAMTGRERVLAAIQYQEVDRLPWWPKIFAGYYLAGQEASYRAMSHEELADYVGVEMLVFPSAVRLRTPHCSTRVERRGNDVITTWETPLGTLRGVERTLVGASHPVEPPAKTAADLRVLQYAMEDRIYEPNPTAFCRAKERVGERGLVAASGPSTPLMALTQHLVGIEPFYYFYFDEEPALFDLMAAMEDANCRAYAATAAMPEVEVVCTIENTSTTITSPEVFRRHCLPALQRYHQIVTDAGKLHMIHMCGHLRDLLPEIAGIGAVAIEAYSPPPVGNTPVALGREAFDGTTAIVGGLNAVMLDQWTDDEVCAYVEEVVGQPRGRRGLVLSSGGVMPPGHSVERLKGLTERLHAIC